MLFKMDLNLALRWGQDPVWWWPASWVGATISHKAGMGVLSWVVAVEDGPYAMHGAFQWLVLPARCQTRVNEDGASLCPTGGDWA